MYSVLFRRFLSDIPKYLQYKKREELYNNSFITGRLEVLFKGLVVLGTVTKLKTKTPDILWRPICSLLSGW